MRIGVLFVLGAVGAVLILLLGHDWERKAGEGPAWRRKLLVLGSAFLVLVGLGGKGRSATPGRSGSPDRHLSRRSRRRAGSERAWLEIVDVYRRADKVAHEPAGSYPFDSKTKAKLLRDLASARSLLDGLVQRGRITRAEADLVAAELEFLADKVSEYRPVELRAATCYEPMPFVPAHLAGRQRLAKRRAVLERLARQRRIHGEVVRLVARRVEADIAAAASGPASDSRAREARRFAERIRRLWRRIKARVGGRR